MKFAWRNKKNNNIYTGTNNEEQQLLKIYLNHFFFFFGNSWSYKNMKWKLNEKNSKGDPWLTKISTLNALIITDPYSCWGLKAYYTNYYMRIN